MKIKRPIILALALTGLLLCVDPGRCQWDLPQNDSAPGTRLPEELGTSPDSLRAAGDSVRVPVARPAGTEAEPAGDEFSDFSYNALSGYVKNHSEPLDWKKLLGGNESVIYIGEIHPNEAIKRELAEHVGDFKEAGITHLALEMLPDDKQPALDSFCKSGTCGQKILSSLTEEWGWVPDSYMGLIEAARKAGLKLAALDTPHSIQKKNDERVAEGGDCADACSMGNSSCEGRDCRMAANIEKVLSKDPKARVLVLAGSFHVQATTQPEHLKRIYGKSSKSYSFLTGGSVFDKGVSEAGFSDSRISFRVPKDKTTYDGFIHIPQVVNNSPAIILR